MRNLKPRSLVRVFRSGRNRRCGSQGRSEGERRAHTHTHTNYTAKASSAVCKNFQFETRSRVRVLSELGWSTFSSPIEHFFKNFLLATEHRQKFRIGVFGVSEWECICVICVCVCVLFEKRKGFVNCLQPSGNHSKKPLLFLFHVGYKKSSWAEVLAWSCNFGFPPLLQPAQPAAAAAVCVCVCVWWWIIFRLGATHKTKMLELYKYLNTAIFSSLSSSTIFTDSLFWRVLFSFSNFLLHGFVFLFWRSRWTWTAAVRIPCLSAVSAVLYLEMLIDIRYVFRWPAQQLLQQRPWSALDESVPLLLGHCWEKRRKKEVYVHARRRVCVWPLDQ